MGRHPTSSHMPSGAGVLSAGFWGSPRPCHSANLGINRAGRQILPLGAVCLLLAPWMEQSGRSQTAIGYACLSGYPGVSLLETAPCLWLPNYGPNISQELGQGLLWLQLCHSHQDRLQPPSCCLLCHKHHDLFSILTMCPFDREKPPSHYSWAVLPCRFRKRWSV